MSGDRKVYLECECDDFDHLIRIWHYIFEHDGDEFFCFDARLNKWVSDREGDPQFKPFQGKWKNRWINFKVYLRTLKAAILGRPVYSSISTLINRKEMKKLADFIYEELKE